MRPLQQNDVFHAIAHPARRTILILLRTGEKRASELAEPFGVSFSAVSQHLKILKEAALVAERREGRNRVYQLHPDQLQEVWAWADEFRRLLERRGWTPSSSTSIGNTRRRNSPHRERRRRRGETSQLRLTESEHPSHQRGPPRMAAGETLRKR